MGVVRGQLPGEAAWRWRVQERVERVMMGGRILGVSVTTVGWVWLPRDGDLWRVPADALLAAAWVYLVAVAVVLWRKPEVAQRYPWGSAALDFMFIAGWFWAVGGARSVYLPLIFAGVSTAPLRLMPAVGVVASVAYGGLYALWAPAGATLGWVYVCANGLVLTAWSALVYRDRRGDLRDALTGLLGRRYAAFRIKSLLRANALPFSVALIDLDGFKGVNDTYGHEAGDTVLCAVSRVILGYARREDVVARWGGDEFLLIWPALATRGAAGVAERLRASVAETVFTVSKLAGGVHLTVSIGVAEAQQGWTMTRLLAAADACLYRAKEQRDTVMPEPG